MKNNLKKFKKHYQNRGLLYAIFRGVKYFFYVIKKINIRENERKVIQRGNLKLDCGNGRVHIYWKGLEVTKDVGLNTSVYILYRWHDSSQADWWVERVNQHNVVIKNRWHNVPISQTWYLFLSDDNKIIWNIQMEVEENLIIDEKRAGIMVNDRYKRWINSYEEGKFPRVNNNWQEIGLKFLESKCIGVKGLGEEKNPMPILFFDFSNSNVNPLPYIQNVPEDIGARMLQARIFDSKEYKSGSYDFFSGEIILKDDKKEVETYIEKFRRNVVKKISRSKTGMKVLLANIPWQKDGRWGVRAGSRWPHLKDSSTEKEYLPFPFFLAYTASLLKENNINAILIDAIALGIGEEKFLKQLEFHKPDLLIAETSTPSLRNDLEILKKINKDTKVALCGPDINIRSPNFLHQNLYIDYILIGEYEYTALDLVKHLQKDNNLENVLGVIFSEDGKTKINPPRPLCNLDDLPWPLREGLPMYKYWDLPGDLPYPSVQMISSRGCPFRCNFCLWPQVMYNSNKYRVRNPQDVVDEMEYLIKKKGFKSIYFDDDTWNIGRERIFKICQEIKKRGLQKVPWAIMARPDLMEKEILTELKSAGLYSIKYGVESANQQLLNNCGKDMDLKKAEDMIRFTKDLGIKLHLTFTFGLPGETEETINQSIRKALELDPTSVQFSITTPYPGTEYFNQLDKQGLIITKDWSDYDGNSAGVFETETLSGEDLKDACIRAYQRWGEHLQRRIKNMGIRYNFQRFKNCLIDRGLFYTLKKTASYLLFLIKSKYLKMRMLDRKIKDRRIKGILSGRSAFIGPRIVEIDLTEQCNNSCLACWVHSPFLRDKQGKDKFRYTLSFKTVKKLIDELYEMGTREIQFSGAGEPFMHPDIIKIVEYIKKKKMKINIITNLTLINKNIAEKLVDLEVDLITASVWAATPQTYIKLHPNQTQETFLRIKETLKTIYQLKRDKNKIYPHIRIYNVLCKLNYQEIDQMIEFALETGADFLEFQIVDIIPGKTNFLLLSHEEKEELRKQICILNEEFNSFYNCIERKSLRRFQEQLCKLESTSRRRFYSLSHSGFKINIQTGKVICPKNKENISQEWVTEETIPGFPMVYSIKLKFDPAVCNNCERRIICFGWNFKKIPNIRFLTLISLESFLRKLSAEGFCRGEYEKEIIDTLPCYIGWIYSRILSNGNVIPCCKASPLPLGNIYKRNFKNIWFSRRYNKFRYKAKYSKKSIRYFSDINCYRSCDNLAMNLEMDEKIEKATFKHSYLVQRRLDHLDNYPQKGLKKNKYDVLVMAKDFKRGNLNPNDHDFGKNLVIDGGDKFGFAEYELYFPKGGRFSLWSRYTTGEVRAVNLYLDGNLICKNALNEVTGGWRRPTLMWFKETNLSISSGWHTFKIQCDDLIPHIQEFLFKRIQADSLQNEVENIYKKRSSLKILYESLQNHGLYYTIKRTARYLKPKNFIDNYLDIIGIFDGSFAYKGPFCVQIDLTNNCNNNCIACWCNSPLLEEKKMNSLTKREYLPYELVKELIDELALMGIKEIYYSGGGEPFMHPEFIQILDYTKSKNITCHINTNFTLLDETKIRHIIDLKIEHLTASIWAGTPEVYDATHPNKTKETFYNIKNNLKLLNSLKQELPYVKLYNVIFNRNYFEIDKMVEFALDTGSDAVEFTVIDTVAGKTDKLMLNSQQREELLKKCILIKEKLDKNFCLDNRLYLYRFDQFLRRISEEGDVLKARYDRNIIDEIPCYIGWLYARILPNGDVNSCLKSHRIPIGNIYKHKFSEIWNNQLQKKFRQKSLTYKKSDPFFRLIGNDPDTEEAGCYKSCDDIGRNLHMHKKIMSLTPVERAILRLIAKYKKHKRRRRELILGQERQLPVTREELCIAGILNGRRAFKGPEHIVIDLTNRCNQPCIGCWLYSPLLENRDKEWLQKELDINVVKSLIDQLSKLGAKKIRYTGGGEPFIHPHIMEILQYTKSKGIETAVTTNFSLLDKEKIRKMVEWKIDELAVSLWAASSRIYKETHPGVKGEVFGEIIENLNFLAQIKNTKPYLTLCNVITNLNYENILDMYKLAQEVKAENIYYTVVDVIKDSTDRLMLSREERNVALKLAKEVKKWNDTQNSKGRINLHFFDGFLRRLSTDYGKEGNYDEVSIDSIPCYVGWYFARIMADGTVCPCCRGVKKPMGNINRKAFREIWFSKEYDEFRYRAKILSKTHPYFKEIGCIKECDNLMHNEDIHKRIINL